MKKNCEMRDSLFWRKLSKLVLIMKFTTLLMLLFAVQLSANVYSQQTRLKVDFNQATLKEVIEKIETQTNLTFFYSSDVLNINQTVTLTSKSMSLEDVLLLISSQTGLSLTVDQDHILVKKEEAGKSMMVQQVGKVTGQVTDASGEPLPGVTIVIEGTTKGAITDTEGNFSLNDVPSKAHLLFSFVGMESQRVAVSGKTSINVVLEEEAIGIEEVIAVGYGTMKKSDLTGSVASIKADDIKVTPSGSVEKLLQGKIAGVQIINPSDDNPQGGATVRVRGASSINGSKAPLVVVDGFPMGDAGSLNMINPNNIASIEVLKDASATAIYGSKGANGVILVSTKRGRVGGTNVFFNTKTSISQFSDELDYWKDPVKMAKLENEAFINQGLEPLYRGARNTLGIYYPSVEQLESGAWPYYTDWTDYVFRTPLNQEYNVGVESSNDKTSFFLNIGYYQGEGMQVKDDYNKFSADVVVEHQLLDNLKVQTKFGMVSGNRNRNGGLNYGRNPIFPVYTGDGSYFKSYSKDYGNVVALLNERTSYNKTKEQFAQLKFDWEISRKFRHTTQLNYRHVSYMATSFYPIIYTEEGDQNHGRGTLTMTTNDAVVGDTYLTYEEAIGKHNFSVMAGVSYENDTYRSSFLESREFTNDILREENLSAGSIKYLGNGYGSPKLLSGINRINYSYNNKYLFTFTSRLDGSSKFGENHRWAYFPSGAFSWRASEEDMIKALGVFDNLKFRASYGISGNQGIPSGLTYERFGESYYYTDGEEKIINGIGYIASRGRFAEWGGIANKSLGWEQTAQANLGVDMSFFNQRLNVVMDVYSKKTTDLLRKKFLPPNTGFDEIWINDGEVQNKGIELSLSGDIIRGKDFNFSADLIFYKNKNKVVNIGTKEGAGYNVDEYGNQYTFYGSRRVLGTDQVVNVLAIGKPINVFYGYKVDGIIQDGTKESELLQPGEYNYVDLNNDGEITSADRTIIGDPNPDFTGSLNLNLSHKSGLSLSMMFYGVYGNDIFSLRKLTTPRLVEGRWTPTNPNNDRPSLRSGRQYKISDWFVEDGSFLRLQNVTLGYDFKRNFLGFFKEAKIYTNATNLFTISNTSEYDPEVGENGIGGNPYPRVSAFTLGINAKF